MAEVKITSLRCNYLENPFGTSLKPPRFSWWMEVDRRGAAQTAYQVQVAKDIDFDDVIWDTEWVKSNVSIQITYEGPALESMVKYFWRVRIQDENKVTSDWSETAHWETGLKHSDWKAEWIEPEDEVDLEAFKPAPYLRKCFPLNQSVVSARLYITSHGLYEAYLNGKRIGDQVFMPGNTSYNHRLQYQVYDVLDLLHEGENCMGVVLGDGWYRGSINVNSNRNAHGEKLALLSQLVLTFADGSSGMVCSDGSWKTSTGPIIKSDMKDGENYDARLEQSGWNEVGFDDAQWRTVHPENFGYQNLIASEGSPVRKMESFEAIEMIHTPSGQMVLDFGQNLAGYITMKVSGPAGTTIKLQHSETLDENGNFSLDYLNQGGGFIATLQQRNEYTLKGGGEEFYEPHFAVQGFRYVWVDGYPREVTKENFKAYAIYSDMGENGSFECSNDKLNQLHKNVLWSQKGNFLDIPTDCPTRERAGWTGDAQIFVHAGSLLMDDAAFYSKWIKDVSTEQFENGLIRNFVPAVPPEKSSKVMSLLEGSSGWGDAVVIIPWMLYQMYGDKAILAEEYESMKKWVEYERKLAEKTHWSKLINPVNWFNGRLKSYQKYIWDTRYHWGEWLEPDLPIDKVKIDIIKKIFFSDPVVASAYFAYSAGLLAKIAEVLGKEIDAKDYAALAENCKKAYIQEFIKDDGTIKVYSEKQAPYVRVLAFGLYTDDLRPKLVEKLVERVENNGCHLGTGFLSTPFLCDVLSEAGRGDLAFDVLLQEGIPSWLYAINHGATTVWEDWDGVKEDGSASASLNHYSKGAVVSWFYEYLCGIQMDVETPAYKHFYLKPQPGGDLTHAKATFTSMYGEIQSSWEKTEEGVKYYFTVPANSSASVTLKDATNFVQEDEVENFQRFDAGVRFNLPSGHYEFLV